jgi:hypothetical protein
MPVVHGKLAKSEKAESPPQLDSCPIANWCILGCWFVLANQSAGKECMNTCGSSNWWSYIKIYPESARQTAPLSRLQLSASFPLWGHEAVSRRSVTEHNVLMPSDWPRLSHTRSLIGWRFDSDTQLGHRATSCWSSVEARTRNLY